MSDPRPAEQTEAVARPASTFGPSALATPANALTVIRLLATPLMVGLVLSTGPSTWLLVGLWFVFSCSDGIDGVLARRQGATRSGAFLDPLADKFLVLGVLASLAAIEAVPWLPVVLIAGREIAMSIFRGYAGRRGVSVPARNSAKVKTLLQDLFIGLVFLPPIGTKYPALVTWCIWVVVAVTLFTGYEYLRDARRMLGRPVVAAADGLGGRHVA